MAKTKNAKKPPATPSVSDVRAAAATDGHINVIGCTFMGDQVGAAISDVVKVHAQFLDLCTKLVERQQTQPSLVTFNNRK